MPLLAQTLAFLEQHRLLATRAVVGVSGGPDSLALAHVLVRLVREGRLEGLVLAHLNHRLRGADSDADEDFVQSLPGLWTVLGVSVVSRQEDAAARAEAEGWNLEDAGRRLRYAFFKDVAKEAGAAWVATGHTANDQAETLLLRLLRGAALNGLSGIAPIRPLTDAIPLIRPWLAVTRRQVEGYVAQHSLPARQDASNQDPRFLRNRVRHELLPYLEEHYQPAAASLLCRLAEQCRETQTLLEALAAQVRGTAEKPRAGAVLVFDAAALLEAAPVVAIEMLRQVWQREGWPLKNMGREEWKVLLKCVEGETTVDLPGVRVVRKGKVVQLHPRDVV